MTTFNPRCFSKPETLRRINPQHLLEFLHPFSDYLTSRNLALPDGANAGKIPYAPLCQIFMSPDSQMPQELVEALFFINEVSNADAFDRLQMAIEEEELDIEIPDEVSPEDLAVRVWLKNPVLLERVHAEQFLTHPRSFEYFRTSIDPVPEFQSPGPETINALERSLDDWFARRRRGRFTRVFVFERETAVWFLVRHGEPFKREAAIIDDESTSVNYRPEKFDVLVYDKRNGEIRMNARSKGERLLYKEQFGLHLFGKLSFFDETARFSLDPLQESGAAALVCRDVDGIDWVRVTELHFSLGGELNDRMIHKSKDYFLSLLVNERKMPAHFPITQCTFEIKFSNAAASRKVKIQSGNKASYKRDDDADVLEEWFRKRGFITVGQNETQEICA